MGEKSADMHKTAQCNILSNSKCTFFEKFGEHFDQVKMAENVDGYKENAYNRLYRYHQLTADLAEKYLVNMCGLCDAGGCEAFRLNNPDYKPYLNPLSKIDPNYAGHEIDCGDEHAFIRHRASI